MKDLQPLKSQLKPSDLDTPAISRQLNLATRQLAELKGIVGSLPRPEMLMDTFGMQEAKDGSAIENIISSNDELFMKDAFPKEIDDPAAKEVMQYREALKTGFSFVKKKNVLTGYHIRKIHAELQVEREGFRKASGTVLMDRNRRVVYTPPQRQDLIESLMAELEDVINDSEYFPVDPLIKMALIHHQFESIHPFYDGNGRTGRVLNVLYLVKEDLLAIPILYLSRYILKTKPRYYELLQKVRTDGAWEEWVCYMLDVIEQTAADAISTTNAIKEAQSDCEQQIRRRHKFYSQALINNLFSHPYTKIEFIQRDLKVSRLTATKYLDLLAEGGLLKKERMGKSNYYKNTALISILTGNEEVD